MIIRILLLAFSICKHVVCVSLHLGPKIKGDMRFDDYCVFPNRVALVRSQVNCLKEVAMERQRKLVYVCTIVDANVHEEKGKMVCCFWSCCMLHFAFGLV